MDGPHTIENHIWAILINFLIFSSKWLLRFYCHTKLFKYGASEEPEVMAYRSEVYTRNPNDFGICLGLGGIFQCDA